MKKDYSVFKKRRQELLQTIKAKHPDASNGVVVLFGSFEHERVRFHQESSFYYLTGIEEPGAALVIDWNNKSTLFIPQSVNRAQWLLSFVHATPESAAAHNVDAIKYLGDVCKTYSFSPLFNVAEYTNMLNLLQEQVAAQGAVFTFNSSSQSDYVEQKLVLARVITMVPGLEKVVQDISPVVASMRRKKTKAEIELMYKAVEITMVAQEAAARVIEDNKRERDIQAGIEYVFAESGASVAFPSIVASGKNSTVLHYNQNNTTMRNGDLVVVDIGAEFDYYCADLTRTYPVSGTFTKRQKEIYNLVLQTQEYIADLAKPGMWLNNKEQPEKSLHHLAKSFLDKKGYGKYFPHGIGHFLGLDVHDVGNTLEPLQEGDVITIEPGIYIPEEKIGVRIEDNYWIIKDGNVCLSQPLPKDAKTIEEMVQQEIEDEDYDDEDEDFN